MYNITHSKFLLSPNQKQIIEETKKTANAFCIRRYGWVSYLHRAATTNYLCCGQALEDSLGAGRIGLTHILV